MIEVQLQGTFENWQKNARELLLAQTAPEQILWREDELQAPLFPSEENTEWTSAKTSTKDITVKVPAAFITLAKKVAYHRDPLKWRLLYSVLWRIIHADHNLLKVQTDDEVIQMLRMRDQVARDEHHMHAFVRFRNSPEKAPKFTWRGTSPPTKSFRLPRLFFGIDSPPCDGAILTPDESVHWDGVHLHFTSGVPHPARQHKR